jgi:hypothetical protein
MVAFIDSLYSLLLFTGVCGNQLIVYLFLVRLGCLPLGLSHLVIKISYIDFCLEGIYATHFVRSAKLFRILLFIYAVISYYIYRWF